MRDLVILVAAGAIIVVGYGLFARFVTKVMNGDR